MKNTSKNPRNQVKSRKKYNKNRNYWRKQAHFVLSASSEGIYWCLSRKRGYYKYVLAAILKYVHQFPRSAFPSLETLQQEIDFIFNIWIHTNSISRITRRMVEDGFLKKNGRLKESNDFDSTMYLLADNFMWREYLEALVPLFPTTDLINLIIQKYKPWTLALLFSINASVHHFKQTVKRIENKGFNLLVTYRESMMCSEKVSDLRYQGCNIEAKRKNVDIPKHIDDIKSINLTVAGKCRLLALTPAGIKAADKKIQSYKGKQVTSLFRLFFSIAASEGGEQPDRLADVATALEENGCRQTDALLENDNINDVDASVFHKREGRSRKQVAWRPAHEDPYYRTEKQRSHFEQQRAKREQEWAQRPPEEQERLHKKAAEFRALLGIDENGEQIAEPDKASGFLYHAAKKRWDEKQKPYTHDVPSWKVVPYIDEDGLWEEV